MIERREGHFTGHQGAELFYQSWSKVGASSPRGTLIITHGISEHSECYAPSADALAEMGWTIYAWDLRGHGRSEGKRGYVLDFVDYSRDLAVFLRFLQTHSKLDESFALIGHSMGGLITLRHLLGDDKSAPRPKAVSLSSPALGIGMEVPAVKDMAARLLNRFLPSVTLYNEVHYEYLSRDPERLKSYALDPLRHDKISSGVYLGMLAAIEFVKDKATSLDVPILIQAAGTEKVVSLAAIKEFYHLLGARDKELIIYEESLHEIFNDLDRDRVFEDLDDFLAPRMKK